MHSIERIFTLRSRTIGLTPAGRFSREPEILPPREMAENQSRPKRDIVVIGTSAGGVAALLTLVGALPATLKASIFVVMHIPAFPPSDLVSVLRRQAKLPISNPQPRQEIVPGHIYVAPNDHHVIIEKDRHISLWHGPKENNFRPSINPLFRSAADVFGNRVVGVIMTGSLDDGVAGLAWVKRQGGVTVVQKPEEALFAGMPRSALAHVPVDYVVSLAMLAPLLLQLANGSRPEPVSGGRKEE